MDGRIVTNRHVASGSLDLEFSTWDGTDFQAEVEAISAGPDLALLDGGQVPPGTTTASPANSDPAPGTPVWAAGYPEGGQLSVLPGNVSGYIAGSSIGASGRIMEITNRIEPGNSGSALLDRAGQVVGVVFAREVKTGDGLAIPVSELDHFLLRPGTARTNACE
jgi:S1-C subfamily serine protease